MKIMDLEIKKYVSKQNQLQEEIKVLLNDKKILQDKIKVLSECLSLKKVKQKISDLENKQKILTSLENMLDNLKSDIKPLEYLKQLLQNELMVSTLSNSDFDVEKQNNLDTSLSTVNSACAIETLDSLSLSDVSSESSDESIIILSEYDVLSDDECLNDNTEKTPPKKVMYDEALQMASSVHSLFSSTIESPIGSILPTPNISDQTKVSNCVKSNFKETTLMNTSSTSEKFLKMYGIVNDEDLHCNNEFKLKCHTKKIEPSTHKMNKLSIFDDAFKDTQIKSLDVKKCDNVSKLFNDSWVKVEPNEIFKISFNSQQHDDIFRSITGLQEDIVMPKFNTEIGICTQDDNIVSANSNSLENESKTELKTHVQHDQLCDYNLELKNINKIYNSVSSNNVLEDQSNLLLLNTKYFSKSGEHNKEKVNNIVQKDQSELVINSDIMNSEKNCNVNVDHIKINQNFVYQNNAPKVDVNSSLLNIKSFNIFNDCNDLSYNINTKISFIEDHKKPLHLGSTYGFNTLGLNAELLDGINQYGFQNLLAFQHKYISHCINKRDVIIHSYPCVGKSTMCFISVLQKIDTSVNECQAIILVPTLELALSAQRVINSIGSFLNVSTCIGGTNVPRKVSPVPHIVISTLHGLCEMINCNSLCKDFIDMLIIDDAEEIIKYELLNKIRQVLLFLNNDRQIIILSNSKFEEILYQFSYTMQNPEHIIVPDERPSLNNVLQYYVYISEEWKFKGICDLYELVHLTQTVVYCNTQKKCLGLVNNMQIKSYSVSILHNDMETSHRQLVLQQFQSGITKVLVTTELPKGENFPNVEWVINYDMPRSSKDYIRRIVGYFDHTVKVTNFITEKDKISKKDIETEFNITMCCLPQNMTDLIVPNFNSVNYPIPS